MLLLKKFAGAAEVRYNAAGNTMGPLEKRNEMKTIEIQVPEPVYAQALELAARENVPLEQIMSLAVTQAVAVWNNNSSSSAQTKRAEQERFLEALTEMLDASPNGSLEA